MTPDSEREENITIVDTRKRKLDTTGCRNKHGYT